MSNDVAVRPSLARAWRYFARHRGLVVTAAVGIGLVSLLRVPVLPLAVSTYAQFEITYQGLADDDMLADGYRGRRFFAVLGVQILVALVVIAGFALFVVPGLYLFLRLSLAVPALIAEETGVIEAVAISWRRTAKQEARLLAVWALAWTPVILSFGAVFAISAAGFVAPRSGAAVAVGFGVMAILVLALLTIVFGWCLSAATYAATRGEHPRLAEVFA